jgi:DMSO/TMAO reductase YedYZ molybdopterin-dependent catalytic subunit
MNKSSPTYLKPYLTTHSLQPENQETPFHFIPNNHVPNELFFRRNHFSYPSLSYSSYWLPIGGAVLKPTVFSINDLLQLPANMLHVVLECAGNKRNLFEPKVFGEQWEKGAISMGQWKGVTLQTLLNITGIADGAKEVVVEGYDYGNRTDLDGQYSYTRSLPLAVALHRDTIIAYEYNRQPIPFKHGYPLRLIVPQWYAMSSVKWIRQIRVINTEFDGPFQSIDYVYYPNKNNDDGAFPVTRNNVNSTIQKPLHMDVLNTGKHTIKGISWTGKGVVTKVEISTDGGKNWTEANIEPQHGKIYEWINWSYEWVVPKVGEFTIMSRATDSFNRIQPSTPFWNRKGYGYNTIDQIKVKVE